MKLFTTTAILLASLGMMTQTAQSATLDVRGETNAFVDEGPYWADNSPLRVKIDPALDGADVETSFKFKVYTQNFTYEPNEATSLPSQYANGKRRSGIGHTHVYATYMDDNTNDPTDPNFWDYTNVFLGAPAATEVSPGILEFDITLPELGMWELNVEIQYDDHTSRVRWHPQFIGSYDVARVNVVPEPSSLALLGLGGLAIGIRRRKRH